VARSGLFEVAGKEQGAQPTASPVAQQHDAPLMSGVLLSAMAVGSIVGGVVLGALPSRWGGKASLS
jgi:hypothetical protein